MKNTPLLTAALCCLCLFGQAQIQPILPQILPTDETRLESYELQGPVKSVQLKQNGIAYSKMSFDAQQRLSEEITYDETGTATMIIRFEYDADGKISAKITTNPLDDKQNDKEVFVYDEQGRLKETKNRSGKTVYEYKSDGRIESQNVYLKNKLSRISTCEYDAQGRLARLAEYYCNKRGNCDPSPLSPRYEYDGQGRPIMSVAQEGKVGEMRSQYRYDEQGRRSEDLHTVTLSGVRHENAIRYAYDGQGRVREMQALRGSVKESTTTYEYDARGNWSKFDSKDAEDKLIHTTERLIEYY